jgi:hypothetical protein
MSKLKLPQDPDARLEYLQTMSDNVEETTFFKKMTSDEIAIAKSDFTTKSLEVLDLLQEKKEFDDAIKERIDPLKKEIKTLGDQVRQGYAETTGKLFKIIDHESKMCYFYSESGELIETKTRPANSDERKQLTIAHSRRTAANE